MSHIPVKRWRTCPIHGEYYGRWCGKCLEDLEHDAEQQMHDEEEEARAAWEAEQEALAEEERLEAEAEAEEYEDW